MNHSITIFDLDNTIIKGNSQRLFLSFLRKRRYITLHQYILIYIWFLVYKVIPHSPENIMRYVARLLKGCTDDEMIELSNEIFEKKLRRSVYRSMVEIINYHRENGEKIILLSNAFCPVVKVVAANFKFDHFIASSFEKDSNMYTGDLGVIMYGENKINALKKLFKNNNYNLSDIQCVYSDHISDLPVLSFGKISYVVNPGTKLKKIAQKKGWPILKLK